MCFTERPPIILHEMRSSISHLVDLFRGSFARFSNCFCRRATNARGGGKHRYRCPLKDKRYLRAIRKPIRIRPEFDGGIRAHFTFPSKRNLKLLPRKRARELSISRHWSPGCGASFFEMALNGRNLLTTKRFTTDTHPELHSTQYIISVCYNCNYVW